MCCGKDIPIPDEETQSDLHEVITGTRVHNMQEKISRIFSLSCLQVQRLHKCQV